MDINYRYLRTDELEMFLQKAASELKRSLLNGADWENIRSKRQIYTDLSIELHRRIKPEDFGESPAERPFRKR